MKKYKYICPCCKKRVSYNKEKEIFFCKKCKKELLKDELKTKRRRPSIFMIILLTIILFIVLKKAYNFTQKNKSYNNQEPIKDIYSEIITDFNNNEISADECTKQMYYSLYNISKVKEEYNGINNVNSNNLIDFIDENYENISDEVLVMALKKIFMANVYIGEKEESNFNISDFLSFNTVYATTEEMKVLDKVKLSNDGKFLIWYTTSGKDKVSEKNISEISNSIDSIISNIEREFNLKYIYSAKKGFSGNGSQLKNMKSILEKNGIAESYLDTAMNVYVVDSGTTPDSALAQYLQSFNNFEKIMVRLAQVMDKETGKALSEVVGVPILPYFNIKPNATKNSEDLNLICAHELTHHFQRYIAGNGKLGNPKSGNFTTETVSNYVAASIINAKSVNNCISDHVSIYVSKCDEKLDTIGLGYANVSFAKVYEEVVADGKQKVLNSVSYKDTLKYFYDVSGGKFEEVMQTLAIKNVTNEYNHNTFKTSILPKNRKDLSDTNIKKHSDNINPVAIHYYYLNKTLIEENMKININLQSNDLSYVLIGKKGNKYIEIGKYNIESNAQIDVYNYLSKYDELVVSIVNCNLYDTISYTLEKTNVQIDESTGIFKLVDSIEFQVKDFFDFFINIIDFYISFINEVEKTGLLNGATNEVNILNQEANIAKDEINNVSKENNKNVKLSEYIVFENVDYNDVHTNINNYLLNNYFKMIDKNIEGARCSLGISIENGINVYLLVTSDSPKEGLLYTMKLK